VEGCLGGMGGGVVEGVAVRERGLCRKLVVWIPGNKVLFVYRRMFLMQYLKVYRDI